MSSWQRSTWQNIKETLFDGMCQPWRLPASWRRYRKASWQLHFATLTGVIRIHTHNACFRVIRFINCNWVVTRWQWLFYMYTNILGNKREYSWWAARKHRLGVKMLFAATCIHISTFSLSHCTAVSLNTVKIRTDKLHCATNCLQL